MELIDLERRSRFLTKAQFGCLRDAYTLNVTRGCEFMCVYCYARGYPEAPADDHVHLYRDLPEKLAAELDNPRRRAVVDWVVFNTASDSFQTHPSILDITFRTMKVLLERGVGLSFLTKGWVPDRFIQLFAHYPGLVTPRVGLVSTNPQYRDLFEPGAASPAERLENIERLKRVKIDVEVRIDPIIPFFTDDEVSIKRLCETLAERDIETVSLSYLHMRPAILRQLEHEIPPKEFNVILSCFKSQPWTVVGASTRSKLIPLPLRERGYQRFMEFSEEYGIKPLVCACKNPDMPAHRCSRGMESQRARKSPGKKESQLTLFPC
ncbi:MAG: radical SAM protein [Proteobacteria bacterium]|nr:radical SAM protein [Pseudomonadota bacterium]